jgi:hypothetical protein
MDTFPPTMLTQELAFVKGWGSRPSDYKEAVGENDGVEPAHGGAEGDRHTGRQFPVISTPARRSARWTTRRACRKIGDVQCAISRGFRKG